MNQNNLSVVIIVKNEEANIARCLASSAWANETIVYDSGSIDKTIEIAQKMGAKVVSGEWKGFGATKKKATLLAHNEWILSVDADEVISEKLKNEIQRKMTDQDLDPEVAYKIPRISFFMGRWIRHGGWYPDYQVRLFNKNSSMWNEDTIHEKVISKKQMQLKEDLQHFVFKNIEHQIATNNRYSSLLAEKMFRHGKKFSYFHAFTKPCVKFVECYFLKLGLLDGWAGYVIAKNAAYSVFLKWIKLKEQYK